MLNHCPCTCADCLVDMIGSLRSELIAQWIANHDVRCPNTSHPKDPNVEYVCRWPLPERAQEAEALLALIRIRRGG